MTQARFHFRWTKAFCLRLLASYVVIPLIPGCLLALIPRGAAGDWLGFVYIYGIFALAAMVGMGTPMLFVYLRLGWTSFLPFMAASAVCSGITAFVLAAPHQELQTVIFFGTIGRIAGAVFRLILFGVRKERNSVSVENL